MSSSGRKAKARNANRRLGDRLWSPEGREYEREMTSSYYLSTSELRSALTRSPLRFGLLEDHSAIKWPDSKKVEQMLADILVKRPIDPERTLFSPTLWRSAEGGWVLLFEEDH